MKPVKSHGLRGKQLLLTLIVIICTSALAWTWNRTTMSETLLHFNVYPTEIVSGDQITEEDEDVSNPIIVSYTDEQAEKILGIDLSDEPQLPLFSEETDQIPVINAINSTLILPGSKQAEEVAGIAPASPVKKITTEIKKEDVDDKIKKEECNYANGKWVPDDNRPFYSGFQCKRWLSKMWACRLTQRPDFSFEGFRWQPENCKMPEFEPKSFLNRMKDKTIAFVGDSLGRQQFQSLMCMVTGGISTLEVQDVGREFGLGKPRRAVRPPGWAYRFTKTSTTILHYRSTTLCELEPLNIARPRTDVALHIDRPVKFLRRYLHKVDVLVLNTGHHWNRGKINTNRWKIYVNGQPVTDRKLLIASNARDFAVRSVVNWVDREIPNHHPLKKVFFRTLSPRHFVNGDWNTGGSCDSTTPLAGGNQANGSYDSAMEMAMKGTKVKLLDVTGLSKVRDEGHISRYGSKSSTGTYDCLHWCLPGIPDTWNEILLAQI